MTLAERLSEYVRAAFTGLWIRSHASTMTRSPRSPGSAATAAGRPGHLGRRPRPGLPVGPTPGAIPGAADPLAAIRSLAALATPEGTAILVLRNFHRFLGSAEVVQALDTRIAAGKQARTFVVILAPVVQVPVELEKLFVVVEHDLPGRRASSRRSPARWPPSRANCPRGTDLGAVLDAAAGLTRSRPRTPSASRWSATAGWRPRCSGS